MLPERLAQAVIPAPVLSVLLGLDARGHQAFLVGGCVRDLLRGTAPKDWDVATSATPAQVQGCFPKVLPTGLEHGTVTVMSRGTPVEVTTFRVEGAYVDGRRPQSVSFRADVVEDLSRRDFTINAMAYSPTRGELVDPFSGQEDLRGKVVRAVGAPLARFSEDGLRALRAVRFATVLDFAVDPATWDAIPATLEIFRKVSVERIREEFQKILLSPRAPLGVRDLRESGLLGVFLPPLADAAGFQEARATLAFAPPVLEVRLAALLLASTEDVRSLTLALRFPNRTADLAGLLAGAARGGIPQCPDGPSLRRLLARLQPENVEPFCALVACRAAVEGASGAAVAFSARLKEEAAARPPLHARALALDGGAIMQMLGVGPSPVVGQATRYLLERVLDEPALNTPGQLAELLRTWAAAAR
ncbi:MAG: [cytidine(C)-cytidine(C)-adenosine (A)]-adding enzyme [Deltaproteobacteria bacterium]|nr:[cytidine(C)-cytidine(C)-adenosine (A)]-adding enzyme [Deltaproteobacteria bacterium]